MINIMLAGIPIGIDNRTDLRPRFWAYETDFEPLFTVSVTEEEINEEEGTSDYSPEYKEFLCLYRRIAERLPDYDAFVFHGCAVVVDQEAYLFTASSGTGKTTHARLWLEQYPQAWILNGDKPVISKRKGVFYVCGTPWQGKENYGVRKNRPIKAVGLLQRGSENAVRKAFGPELAQFLMHQVFLPRDPTRMSEFLDLLNEFCNTVPAYSLDCNMDAAAATLAYETMSGKRRVKA